MFCHITSRLAMVKCGGSRFQFCANATIYPRFLVRVDFSHHQINTQMNRNSMTKTINLEFMGTCLSSKTVNLRKTVMPFFLYLFDKSFQTQCLDNLHACMCLTF